MTRPNTLLLAAALASMTLSVPALARTELTIPATATWNHGPTGVLMPPTLVGQRRISLIENVPGDLDMAIDYRDGDIAWTTIYIFRPAGGDVPMWFDRAETQITLRPEYADVTPGGDTRSFTPPKALVASGLRRAYTPNGSSVKATALAVMPVGEWLVAVRFSSGMLGATELDAKLTEVIAALRLPAAAPDDVAALPVAACAGSVGGSSKAKLIKPDLADALIGATLAGMTPDDKGKDKDKAPKRILWCRDGEPTQTYGVYREKGTTNAFVLALGDAGNIVSVGPTLSISASRRYGLTWAQLDRTLVYPSFDRLPSPDRAFAAINGARPTASTSRGGKEITIDAK